VSTASGGIPTRRRVQGIDILVLRFSLRKD